MVAKSQMLKNLSVISVSSSHNWLTYTKRIFMKRLFIVGIFWGVFCIVYTLNAQSLESRRADLQRQIQDLEIQKEIQELEKRLKILQDEVQAGSQDINQQEYDDDVDVNVESNLESNYNANIDSPKDEQITRDNRDEQVRKWFGKNRNGLLFGFGWGQAKITSQGEKFSYTQELPTNVFIPEVTGASAPHYTPNYFRLGYQKFISFSHPSKSPLGFRIYADYINMLGHSSKTYYYERENKDAEWELVGTKEKLAYQYALSANLDMLLEFNLPNSYSYFGIFGGVGYGILRHKATYNAESSSNGGDFCNSNSCGYDEGDFKKLGIFYNLGVALTLGAKHRLEFYYKILPIKQYAKDNFTWRSSDYMAFSYQYTF